MIVCTECGNAAPSSDGFCSSCGALLEWSGEPAATPPTAYPTAPPATPPAAVSSAPPVLPGQPAPAAPAPAVVPAGSAPDAAPPGVGPHPSGPPVAGVPVVRQPSPEAERPEPTPLRVEPDYTGPFCSACGVRNPPDRTFCRSCGERLRVVAAPAAPAPSWWRRLWARVRGRRGYSAGDRPRGFRRQDQLPATGRRRRFRLRRVSVGRFGPLVVLLGLLGVGLGPARQWITDEFFALTGQAKDRLHEHFVPVAPVGATGSTPVAGHGAGLAVDGVRDTFFASPGQHDGAGTSLVVRFADPVDIDQLGLLSGEPQGAFRTDSRPRALEVTVPGADPVRIGLDDTADFQQRPLRLRGVRTLTVRVVEVYPGQQGHAVALREVQFFVSKR